MDTPLDGPAFEFLLDVRAAFGLARIERFKATSSYVVITWNDDKVGRTCVASGDASSAAALPGALLGEPASFAADARPHLPVGVRMVCAARECDEASDVQAASRLCRRLRIGGRERPAPIAMQRRSRSRGRPSRPPARLDLAHRTVVPQGAKEGAGLHRALVLQHSIGNQWRTRRIALEQKEGAFSG